MADSVNRPTFWLCPCCIRMRDHNGKPIETKLALVENDIIRIKRKDVYVEFQGTGLIRMPCYKCATIVEQMTDDYRDYLTYLKTKKSK